MLLDTYTKVIDDDVLGAGGRTIEEIGPFCLAVLVLTALPTAAPPPAISPAGEIDWWLLRSLIESTDDDDMRYVSDHYGIHSVPLARTRFLAGRGIDRLRELWEQAPPPRGGQRELMLDDPENQTTLSLLRWRLPIVHLTGADGRRGTSAGWNSGSTSHTSRSAGSATKASQGRRGARHRNRRSADGHLRSSP